MPSPSGVALVTGASTGIGRHLVQGLADSAGRLNILKALVQVADGFGTELIAEGVDCIPATAK